MGKLLTEESPLQLLPSVAVKIGLNEAIILQQIKYWLIRSNHVKDGKKWVYNSYPEWNKQFPFWSKNTMIKAFKSLERQGLLITGNYNKAGFDKTKWYTINQPVFDALECNGGVVEREPETGRRETRNWYMEEPETGRRETRNRDTEEPETGRPIPIDYQENTTETTSENNITTVSNSKIENSSDKPDVNSNVDQVNEFRKVQSAYENTIGNLSSFVIQDIKYWIKDTSSELIIEAIKRADANNVHNWKYVSSILKSWAKYNFKTLEQVQANDVEYRNKKASNNSNKRNNNNAKSEHFRPGDYDDMEERIKNGKLPF